MIEFCDNNEGFMSAILSVVGLIVSIVAIVISICTAKKQSKIELFNERYQVYYSIDEFVDKWLFYLYHGDNELVNKLAINIRCRYGLANIYAFKELYNKDLSIEKVCGTDILLKMSPLHNEMLSNIDKAILLFGNEDELSKFRQVYVELWNSGSYNVHEENGKNDVIKSFLVSLEQVRDITLKKMKKKVNLI